MSWKILEFASPNSMNHAYDVVCLIEVDCVWCKKIYQRNSFHITMVHIFFWTTRLNMHLNIYRQKHFKYIYTWYIYVVDSKFNLQLLRFKLGIYSCENQDRSQIIYIQLYFEYTIIKLNKKVCTERRTITYKYM